MTQLPQTCIQAVFSISCCGVSVCGALAASGYSTSFKTTGEVVRSQ
jgi:hypothetical protein